MKKNDFIKALLNGIKIAFSILFGIPGAIATIVAVVCLAVSGTIDERFGNWFTDCVNKFIEKMIDKHFVVS